MATQFKMTRLAVLVSGLFVTGYAVADDSNSYVGNITVQGQDQGGTNSGLIQQEDSPKSRSSVTKAEIDKKSQTNNPYQMLNLAPGVNTYDYDGTGLFGGGMRVRGFNSDELGFTVDGVPVNDSGSFAVYPQEYADSNNLCNIFVTQGSTDIDAPHIGASGGNIGINTCDPEDKHRLRIKQTIGSNELTSSFIRIDTGRFLEDTTKAFVSYSHTEADKWKGEGEAKKDHVDFKITSDVGGGSNLSAGLIYNRAFNNNYLMPTKAQIAKFGYNIDYGTTAPVHQPINGTATLNDTTYAPNANITTGNNLGYYGLSLNPFENFITTFKAHIAFSNKVSFDLDPYLWYGYGTGGNELFSLTEGLSSTKLNGGVGDLNGNGNTKDTLYYYNGSLTRTWRPGVTSKFNFQLADNNQLQVGYWIEKARQAQTGPYLPIDNFGNSLDPWESNTGLYATYANGLPYQFRNWNTVSTSSKAFIQDNLSLLKDKLNIQLGVSYASTDRDFTNYPNSGSAGSASYYEYKKTFNKVLPSLGVSYHFTPEHQVYFNAAENFKVPGNFTYSGLLSGGTIVNGVYTGGTVNAPNVVPETSNNFDLGYRYQGKVLTFSGSLYYVDFKNRIASAFDPVRLNKVDYNVGDAPSKGAEFELGYQFLNHWTAYSSLTYMKNDTAKDIPISATLTLPSKGKALPDDPNWLAGFSLEYARDQWYIMGQAKYTGHRYTTLVNDDALGGYTVFNLDAGYKLPSFQFVKNPKITFNAYNLFNKQFLNLNTSSGSAFTTNALPVATANGTISANTPSFVVGAPRTFAVTLQADF